MYSIIYFSPTGNVLHLAKMLAEGLNSPKGDILPLEFTDPEQLESNKHLVLLYPVHGFNPSRPVKRFVKSLSPALYEFVSLIGVGCTDNWLNGAVSSDLHKSLTNKGYSVVVDEILAMHLPLSGAGHWSPNLKIHTHKGRLHTFKIHQMMEDLL